jgi:hypothetical protein
MPLLWFSQRGEPMPLSYEEISGAFGNCEVQFVSAEFPKTASNSPLRTLIEVEESDARSAKFPKPGFYVVPDMSPEKAGSLLSRFREKVQ